MNESGNEDHSQQFFVQEISEEEEPPSQREVLHSPALITKHQSLDSLSSAHRTVPLGIVHFNSHATGSSASTSVRVLPTRGETPGCEESASTSSPPPWAAASVQVRDNPRTAAFRQRYFPNATDEQWNDWRWQSRHRIRSLEDFERIVDLSPTERDALRQGGTMLPVGVTPYYMSLIDRVDPTQPLRKTVIPTTSEFVRTPGEADDPLGEDGHSPVPGLVHRYPDRVLLLPLDFCSTYCRYCTRSRVVGHGEIVPNEVEVRGDLSLLGGSHAGPRRVDFGRGSAGAEQ